MNGATALNPGANASADGDRVRSTVRYGNIIDMVGVQL
jgi:hypothetical protein